MFFIILSSVCVLACSKTQSLKTKDIKIKTASGKSVGVKAEIADTDEKRQKGYMFRKNILDGNGMLFIFEKDQILGFWMKNTICPLSIAYIDSTGHIRDIFDMKPQSLATVESTVSVRYALEVPQGWFQKESINVGDYLILDF